MRSDIRLRHRSDDGTGIPAAVAAAAAADTVVMVLGTDLTGAAESHDAVNITLTEKQTELVARVTAVSKRKVIAILMTATPLDISTVLLNNPKVGAVMHVGQPSVTILGVGHLLFGKRSPAGRTVQTFYTAKYQDQVSIFDFNMRPGPSLFVRMHTCEAPICRGKIIRFLGVDIARGSEIYF